MKKIIKLSRVFSPGYYRWIILPVSTLVLSLFSIVLMAANGTLGYSIGISLDAMVLLFADMVVFNGVASKGTRYKLLMASNQGRNVLKNGLLVDNLYRFVQLAAVGILGYAFNKIIFGGELLSFGFAIVSIITAHALGTCGLVFLRHIKTMTMYGPTLSLVSVLIILPLVMMALMYNMPIFAGSMAVPLVLLVLALALMAFACFLSVKNVLNNYDRSFGGK